VYLDDASVDSIGSGSSFNNPLADSNCYDSGNIGTVGIWDVCNGMFIVDRTMLFYAIDNNLINSGEDFYYEFAGQNYTLGDSSYNVFTGQVTDRGDLLEWETNFNSNINYWDVSSVTNMIQMFYGTLIFNQDISSWNVSSVTMMGMTFMGQRGMFSNADSFNQDLSGWDVVQVSQCHDFAYSADSYALPKPNFVLCTP
jgi:surface protein